MEHFGTTRRDYSCALNIPVEAVPKMRRFVTRTLCAVFRPILVFLRAVFSTQSHGNLAESMDGRRQHRICYSTRSPLLDAKTTYVLMAGLPATGKSTLARELARRLDGVVLDKDAVRAALFPGAMTDYSAEQDDLCIDAILEAAAYLVRLHKTAFLFIDGRTFARHAQLTRVIHAVEETGSAWKILHLACEDDVASARLAATGEHPATNRNFELYHKVKASFEPIVHPKLDLDTSSDIDECVQLALEYLSG
jgi:predicted kinase